MTVLAEAWENRRMEPDDVVEACRAQIAACVALREAYDALHPWPRTPDGDVDWAEQQHLSVAYAAALQRAVAATKRADAAQGAAWDEMRPAPAEEPSLF